MDPRPERERRGPGDLWLGRAEPLHQLPSAVFSRHGTERPQQCSLPSRRCHGERTEHGLLGALARHVVETFPAQAQGLQGEGGLVASGRIGIAQGALERG